MAAGYGIAVEGLRVGALPMAPGPASVCLRWSTERAVAHSDAPAVWVREEEEALIVGWAGFAEYGVRRSPSPEVRASLMGADEDQAALRFVLAVLPLALPLFGLEPMHASAVAVDGRGLLLLGASGAGKSTLASRLAGRGWRFLADDASAIDASGWLWPGPPLLARRSGDEPWPVVGPFGDKTVVRLAGHPPDAIRPGAVAVLAPKAGVSLGVRALEPATAIKALLGHVRAPGVLAIRRLAPQLEVASGLAALPVCEVSYEHGQHSVDDVAETVAAWAESAGGMQMDAAVGAIQGAST